MPYTLVTPETLIYDVVVGVAHYIDGRQWEALRMLFADVVVVDYTSLFGGEVQTTPGDELIDGWRQLLTPLDATQHLLGPVIVDCDARAGVASARCHVRGYHYLAEAEGGPTWTVAGHYRFRLRKGDGAQWRIAAMALDTYYQTGNANILEEAGARAAADA